MRGLMMMGGALGFVLVGAATGADAQGERPTCGNCGAARTTRYDRTIHPLLYVTRYHDRSVYHHVTRLHYVVGVTRIQPIIHVRDVTRLHHVTVVGDAYAYPPQAPVPVAFDQERPVNAFGQGCACLAGE